MKEENYLTNIPENFSDYGLCKTLVVRREIIHIKHILTEIFVRKSIDVTKYLDKLDMDLFDYMEYITNRIRKVHHFSRGYKKDCNEIVKNDRDRFFPSINLYNGLDTVVVLDFDGVVTSNNFRELYNLCLNRCIVEICSANPNIKKSWFDSKNIDLPYKINSMKGKIQKIKRLIEIQKKHDYVFYVDDEVEYLEYAWIFGIQSYRWENNNIKLFTLKTK